MSEFDVTRAMLSKPDLFPRFRVPDRGTKLATAQLDPEDALIIVERGGVRRGLRLRQMAVHHVAEGVLGEEPYVVSF